MMAKGQMVNVNMTHTMTINRTTTSYTALYLGYLKTPPGFLKLAQLICCIVIVTLLGITHSDFDNYLLRDWSHLFFFTVAVAFLIITFCIISSYILSLTTYHYLGKTCFETIFNTVGFLLFVISTTLFFVHLNEYYFSRSQYNMVSISGYCGGALALLYLVNAIIAR